MEIILLAIVLGLVVYWIYGVNQKRKQAESVVAEAPYKVESPVLATPVVEEPAKVDVIPAGTEASVSAPVKATKPKAAARTAKPKAPAKAATKAKAPAKPKAKPQA